MVDLSFYKGKRVFVTGHTGFKGAWMCRVLVNAGAQVTGFALEPPTDPNLFFLAGLGKDMHSVIGDVRDSEKLKKTFQEAAPEVVLHLAAQPIVRTGYEQPAYTYETNVMGTVNLMECVRLAANIDAAPCSVVNITTDKVYLNREWCWGYREDDPLDGFDPYSNSKSCSELVTHSYCTSFFNARGIPVSTARAGNVIGGGDFARDRIIPDCIRAVMEGEPILVRNPHSTRPYQHVLEPVMAYLMIAQRQAEEPALAGWYNVGPDDGDCVTTGQLVDMFCRFWGEGACWEEKGEFTAPHEANFLKLDCAKLKNKFGWQPRWHIEEALDMTCQWTKAWLRGESVSNVMDTQIKNFVTDDSVV